MKFTEQFFKFPIRVTKYEIEKGEEEMFSSKLNVSNEWVRGVARIPMDEIIGWYDSFSDYREIDDVAENGFDVTILETRTMGEFIVNMKREKFEELLDKFDAKLKANTEKEG